MSEKPKQEHIFPATHLTKLTLQWKELTENGESDKALKVLEEIIIGSTNMFERLAQHEGFHHTVDLDTLVAAAQSKVVNWIVKWEPHKGRLFSWFSKCARNAFLSEIVKAQQYKNRFFTTSDNLEKFYGEDHHPAYVDRAAKRFLESIANITVRWGDPQEVGSIKFLVQCVIDTSLHDKQKSIRAVSYAYGVSPEMAKFFYNWVLIAMRDQLYDQIHVPFTEQDLFRHAHSYTHLVDLLDIITWDQMKKVISVMGGTRMRIPTLAQMARLKDDYETFTEIDKSDLDPDAVAAVAKKRRRNTKNAQEVYEEMSGIVNPSRSEENYLSET